MKCQFYFLFFLIVSRCTPEKSFYIFFHEKIVFFFQVFVPSGDTGQFFYIASAWCGDKKNVVASFAYGA